MIYAAFETRDNVLLGGVFRNSEEIYNYKRSVEDDGYGEVNAVCIVPLMVSGRTYAERKEDFLKRVKQLAIYGTELTYYEEAWITDWVETIAIRTGTVRQLRAMNIL